MHCDLLTSLPVVYRSAALNPLLRLGRIRHSIRLNKTSPCRRVIFEHSPVTTRSVDSLKTLNQVILPI